MKGKYLGRYRFTDEGGHTEIVCVYDCGDVLVSRGWMSGDFIRRHPLGDISQLKVEDDNDWEEHYREEQQASEGFETAYFGSDG
jgi:hypothetical protein